MFPINPRELQKQLKQLKKLGIKMDQIENARMAYIELSDKKIVLENPEVFVIEFGDQKMFYILGQNIREEPKTTTEQSILPSPQPTLTISEEDIKFVAEYTNVSLEKAREAIVKAGGDLAKAIELIESEKNLNSKRSEH
ncbi:MAG: nascent polypeptide-associated complex protein [Ignisphaera sp.]